MTALPHAIRQSLLLFLNTPADGGLCEQQQRMITLLDLYQQATSLQQTPFVTSSQDEQPQLFAPQDEQRLSDELQRLITELDFAGAIGASLSDIRRQLLSGLKPTLLASTCLRVIELIIEGTRAERTASRAFLTNLNERLALIHSSVTQSLDEGRLLQQTRTESHQALQHQIQAIDHSLTQYQHVDSLKAAISEHLVTLNTLLHERSESASRENSLLNHISKMESKIRLITEETAEYKKRLTIQKHKLFLDSLTQVHNRAALDERLEQEYRRWVRYRTPLCLAIIDIDHFKQINDNYGHMAGDKALKVVAKALQRTLRDTDFIARFGGEEFVVLLPNINPEKFQKPLETLRQTIKHIPFRFRDTKVAITISIGATLFREGDTPSEVFERADKALYHAKHTGRDQVMLA